MLLGHMPNQAVLQKYDLMQFNEVVQAVKQGNLLRLIVLSKTCYAVLCSITNCDVVVSF